MYCPHCGTPNQPEQGVCDQCQSRLDNPPRVYTPIENDAGMRMLLPIGRSMWAILAGYLALVSVLILPAPLALLFGIIAIVDIKRHPEKRGMGRAIFGLIAGGLFTLLLTVFIILLLLE